jgi:short-subunit dehydrogenase
MSGMALVTGASSGIGEAFARRLSRMGYHVLLVARRKARLESLASELGNADVLVADLAIDSELRNVENRVIVEPGIEFLVNNAGFGLHGSFSEASLELQDRMHRLHVIAIERLTHAALRGMVTRRKGNIINVSSVAGFFPTPYNVSYSATKAWITGFTEGLHVELRAMNSPVRVQSLCPGFTHSEFHDVVKMDRSVIPDSMWMSAEDVIDASLRGLKRNKPIVVPGWRYKLLVGLSRCLPRSLQRRGAIMYANSKIK